jgi:hypothetical protein
LLKYSSCGIVKLDPASSRNLHSWTHINKEAREKQSGRKLGPNRAEMGLCRPTQPILGPVQRPLWPRPIWTIYSHLTKSHEERHLSSAAEEQRREGHLPGEERVEMMD